MSKVRAYRRVTGPGYLQRHPHAYTSFKMARSPTSSRDRLYQSSLRHPRTYILTYFFHKQNFQKFFPVSLPHLQQKVLLRHSQPPLPPLRQRHLLIPLLALRTLGFFPASLPQFTPFLNGFTQALPTSTAFPTPTPSSDSPHRLTYPTIFSRLSTSIYASCEAVEPNLQRHRYANAIFGFHSSRYVP